MGTVKKKENLGSYLLPDVFCFKLMVATSK